LIVLLKFEVRVNETLKNLVTILAERSDRRISFFAGGDSECQEGAENGARHRLQQDVGRFGAGGGAKIGQILLMHQEQVLQRAAVGGTLFSNSSLDIPNCEIGFARRLRGSKSMESARVFGQLFQEFPAHVLEFRIIGAKGNLRWHAIGWLAQHNSPHAKVKEFAR